MNFKSGKRKSPSHPSRGGKVDVPKAEAEEEGAIAASVLKNMKAISKQKGEVGEVNLPKPLIISLFEDNDMKKAIRASVSTVEVEVK
eukprot:14620751-Ditylum_brightwellii.AAC.1